MGPTAIPSCPAQCRQRRWDFVSPTDTGADAPPLPHPARLYAAAADGTWLFRLDSAPPRLHPSRQELLLNANNPVRVDGPTDLLLTDGGLSILFAKPNPNRSLILAFRTIANMAAIGSALDDGIGPNNVALDPILYLYSEIIMGYQNKDCF